MPPTRVVIADDEPAVLDSTAELLELLGFEVTRVADARTIAEVVRAERPHVLLQDLRMPGLDTEGHLRALRARPELAGLRVIVYSALLESEERWLEAGADAAIEKPFRIAELRALIERLVAG